MKALIMISILMASTIALAGGMTIKPCPYAKNLQGNSTVGMFNEDSNYYNKVRSVSSARQGADPRAVQRRK